MASELETKVKDFQAYLKCLFGNQITVNVTVTNVLQSDIDFLKSFSETELNKYQHRVVEDDLVVEFHSIDSQLPF